MPCAVVLPAGGARTAARAARCTRRTAARWQPRRVCAAAAADPPPPPAAAEHAALLSAATAAVHRAARLCVDIRTRFDASGAAGGSLSKADATPVTVADFAVQVLLSCELGRAFSHIPLVAEEDAGAMREPGSAALLLQVVDAVARAGMPCGAADVLAAIDRGTAHAASRDGSLPAAPQRWVLDPIDGTRGFLRGGDAQYAVGLALLDASPAPVLGVMALPNWRLPPASADARGVVLVASRGGGAWVRPLNADEAVPWQRAQTDAAAALCDATVCVSDHEVWADTPMAAAAAPAKPAALMPLCCGSLVKYAAVALGNASMFVQHPVPDVHRLKSWDHAAGVACVLDAGGAVVDFSGRPVDLGAGREFVPAGLGVLVCATPLQSHALPLLPAPSSRPLLALLDRDGCINVDRGTWIQSPELLRLLPGAAAAVAALNAAGITTAVVTNQSCVGRGLLSWDGLDAVNAAMTSQLAAGGARVDALFVAPDDPESGAPVSARRKPGPGMLLEAMALYGVPPERCVMVGDTVSDMRAAAAAGVARRMLLCTGHGERYAVAAAAAGLALPLDVRDDGGPIASLLPSETLPLQLHADLASATRALLVQ
jgi:3'(2'), 5'-bisphosphate nucleotidase